jgi:environmental stress-induced protein Ves
MRIIRATDCRTMPWKNGQGITTEIAVSPEGSSLSDFDWRVSMTQVGADGPFSAFPGLDRTLCVLTGAGIRLAFGDGETVALDHTSPPFAFAADRAVDGLLIDGPIIDLNVMSRRGAWTHSVERITGPGEHRIAGEAILLLVAPDGGWSIDKATLSVGDSALIQGQAEMTCLSDDGGHALYVIRLAPQR